MDVMPIPEPVRELRPHALWDIIREGVKMMIPFLTGLGIKSWVHDYATPLMWTAAIAAAALIAYSDRIPRRKKATTPLPDDPYAGKRSDRTNETAPSLQIISARYGIGGTADKDVTGIVRELAKSGSVNIPGRQGLFNGFFGDPYPLVPKYLKISYSAPAESEVTFNEDAALILPALSIIKTAKTQTEYRNPLSYIGAEYVGRKIESAVYAGPTGSADVTEKIKALHDDEEQHVNHYELCAGQDPSYGKEKFLTVTYSETLKEGAMYLSQNRWLRGDVKQFKRQS
jgi:hypothetical protein